MSLVTTKDLMLDAQKNHYAIGSRPYWKPSAKELRPSGHPSF